MVKVGGYRCTLFLSQCTPCTQHTPPCGAPTRKCFAVVSEQRVSAPAVDSAPELRRFRCTSDNERWVIRWGRVARSVVKSGRPQPRGVSRPLYFFALRLNDNVEAPVYVLGGYLRFLIYIKNYV